MQSQERAVTGATDVQAGSRPLTLPPTTSISVFSCLIFQWKLFTCWDGLRKCSQKRKNFCLQIWSDRERAEKERRSQQREEAGQGPDKRQQAWGNAKTSLSTANLKCSYFPKDNTEFFLILVFFFFFGCHNLHSMKYGPHTRIRHCGISMTQLFFFNFISRL